MKNESESKDVNYGPLNKIVELLRALNELKPFLEDKSNYLGVYEGPASRICKLFGWKRK